MTTLLCHIQSWMQNSIVDIKDRIEKQVHQIQEVYKRLDAFNLLVLARPDPDTNLNAFRLSWPACEEMLMLS